VGACLEVTRHSRGTKPPKSSLFFDWDGGPDLEGESRGLQLRVGPVERLFDRLVCLVHAKNVQRVVLPPSIVNEPVVTKTSVFGISVSTSDLLAQLCLDGILVGMQEELSAATIDASSVQVLTHPRN
jgi:hypothetical protein